MSEEPDRLEAQKQAIFLSDEAEKFLNTPLGRQLLERSQAERAIALLGLRDIDPTKTKKIRELQSTIKRAESFPKWIDDLIHEGDAAYEEFEAENNTPQE